VSLLSLYGTLGSLEFRAFITLDNAKRDWLILELSTSLIPSLPVFRLSSFPVKETTTTISFLRFKAVVLKANEPEILLNFDDFYFVHETLLNFLFVDIENCTSKDTESDECMNFSRNLTYFYL
jgi:hypothetical protein